MVLKGKTFIDRRTLGDKLQQHVAATGHSLCTGWATSCSNKLRRLVAVTNRFVCFGEFLWRSLSPQQHFVAATSCMKSNLWDLLLRQKPFAYTTILRLLPKKFYSTHEAICRCDVSPQNVAANCRLVCTDLNVQVMYRNPCKSLTKSCMLR